MKDHVSRETRDRLEVFVDLFVKWSSVINLVAPSTKKDLWNRHVWDSAQLATLAPRTGTWVDLGSGGGFPGVITAILLTEIDEGWVHLVESNHKKASFLRMALAATGARGTVHPLRIEDAAREIGPCDFVSARALAHLSKLLTLSSPWLVGTPSIAFFHKGRDYLVEVDKARGEWSFDLLKHQSQIEAESVILEISQLQPL